MSDSVMVLGVVFDQDSQAYDAWFPLVDALLTVEPLEGETKAQALQRSMPFSMEGYWVILIEKGESPITELGPEIVRRELERAQRKIEQETRGQDGLPEPTMLTVLLTGDGWATETAVARVYYVPEERTWEDEWEWRYELFTKALPMRRDRRTAGAHIPGTALKIRDRIGPCQAWFDVLDSLDYESMGPADRAHYQTIRDGLSVSTRPVLSLCVIFRELNIDLMAMLWSAEKHVNEIVLVATAPVDWSTVDLSTFTVPIVTGEYRCKEPIVLQDGTELIDDFSAARQYSFSLARGIWRMFLDSDDELIFEGQGESKPIWRWLDKILTKEGVNCVTLPYEYSPTITQTRACIWKWLDEKGRELWAWDGCPVHERVTPTAWLDGRRVFSVERSGSDFYIQHKGNHDEASWERNALIARKALSAGVDDEIKPRLLYVLGFSLVQLGLEDGKIPLFELMRGFPREAYAMNAAIDYGSWLLDRGRWREVPEVVQMVLDYWPGEPELKLTLARARRAAADLDVAALLFQQTYFSPMPAQPIRVLRDSLEFSGRLEAAELFTKLGLHGDAVKVLEQMPQDVRMGRLPEFNLAYHAAQLANSQARVSESALSLIHFLLSIDCVDKAQDIADSFPLDIRRSPQWKVIRKALEKRERHLEHPELYQKAYGVLNESDVLCGARPHMPTLVERIVEYSPDWFIDVGCNTGWVAHQVALQLPECRVLGIDTGYARVDEARERAKALGLDPERVRFLQCEHGEWSSLIDNYEAEESRVAVLCSEVLEHVGDLDTFLDNIAFSSTRLFLTVPDFESYDKLVTRGRRLDLPFNRSAGTILEGFEHVRCFTAHELVEALHGVSRETQRVERIKVAGEESADLLFVNAHRNLTVKIQKPRLDILCQGFIPWGPRAHLEGHVGGSEQAVIHLAPELVHEGWDVHVYASPMKHQGYEQGVWWHHEDEFVPSDERSATIVWRKPQRLREIVDAQYGRSPTLLWCHDTPEEIRYVHAADKVLVLSEYQRELFEEAGIPRDKLVTLQNGVVRSELEKARESATWKPRRVFWGSSADRGLLHLLRMWPKVLESIPDAELVATYRQDLLRHPMAGPVKARIADEVERLARELPGVTFRDGLSHPEYLKLMATCDVWAGLSNFTEISCIVAMEAQALGLACVATDLAALKETVLDHDLTVKVPWVSVRDELIVGGAEIEGGAWWIPEGCYSQTYLCRLLDSLAMTHRIEARADLSYMALSRYDWRRTAALFTEAIQGVSNHGNSRTGQ